MIHGVLLHRYKRRIRMDLLTTVPRCALGFFPTPLVSLKNLEKQLGGPRIFMKRDDQTGLGLGGNKTRKLEYLLGDALAQGADCIINAGAAQSNHCRQTAAAAAVCGVDCHLALGGSAPETINGNLLLDILFGAELH
jgi:L-cysteate sulfo-lyase